MSRTRSILAIAIVALGWIAAIPSFAQEPPAPWRDDALFKRLAAKLDAVPAIDNHTHLGGRTVFDPDLDRFSPLLLRSTNPWLPSILKSRFGVTFAGDWKAAIAALDKSMELRKGGNSKEWFFLAMAHWQLGEKDKAREFYDRAVQWMDKNQPTHEELLRFRAEAEELMKKE